MPSLRWPARWGAIIVVATGAPMASADVTGRWRVVASNALLPPQIVCSVDLAQAGSSVTGSGGCDIAGGLMLMGTVDGAGALTLASTAKFFVCDPLQVQGTLAPDGRTFTGTYTCGGLFTPPLTGPLAASRCGGGLVDPGEECDDGNVTDGDCCSATCTREPSGSPCPSDLNQCTNDVCDGAGTCVHSVRTGACDDGNSCTAGDACTAGTCTGAVQPDGSACEEGDLCTSGDTCRSGTCDAGGPTVCDDPCEVCYSSYGCVPDLFYCREPDSGANTLVLRDTASPSIGWSWVGDDATTTDDFGDPSTGTSYALCVFDSDYGADGWPRLLLSAEAPAGARWQPSATGFTYTSAAGLQKVRLKASSNGGGVIKVKGRGASLDMPSLASLVLPVTVELRSTDDRPCWGASYDTSLRSNPVHFKARSR